MTEKSQFQKEVDKKLRYNTEEINSLRKKIASLEKMNNYYENRIIDLKRLNKELVEIDIKNKILNKDKINRENRIDNLEKEILSLTNNDKAKKRQIENELESEVIFYKGLLDSGNAKIDAAENILKLNNAQNDYIVDLEEELEKLRSNSDVTICKLKIEHDIHFYNLKKKMMNYVKEIQQNMTKNNNDTLEMNSKLGMLFKNQMMNELEHQATLIKELLKIKEKYEKIIFVLNQDLKLHKKVEKIACSKNMKYVNIIKDIDRKYLYIDTSLNSDDKYPKGKCLSEGKNKKKVKNKCKYKFNKIENDNSEEKNEAQLSIFKSIINNNQYQESNINNNSNMENKFKKYYNEYISLKKLYIELLKENQNLKDKISTMKDKQKMYHNKFSGILKLYKNALEELLSDEEIKNNNIKISKEIINGGDYESFSREQKYIIITSLIKHLLPLMDKNCNDNDIDILKDSFQRNNYKIASPHSSKKEEIASRNNTISQLNKLNFRSLLDNKNNICDSKPSNLILKQKDLKTFNSGRINSLNLEENKDFNSIYNGFFRDRPLSRNKVKLFKCIKSKDKPLRFIYINNKFNMDYDLKNPADTCLTKNNFLI